MSFHVLSINLVDTKKLTKTVTILPVKKTLASRVICRPWLNEVIPDLNVKRFKEETSFTVAYITWICWKLMWGVLWLKIDKQTIFKLRTWSSDSMELTGFSLFRLFSCVLWLVLLTPYHYQYYSSHIFSSGTRTFLNFFGNSTRLSGFSSNWL